MGRVYNFSAGPSMLTLEVLETAAKEMTDYNGSGMSVMEMSHRSKAYESIINAAFDDLRQVLNIPENYKLLYLLAVGVPMQESRVCEMENGDVKYFEDEDGTINVPKRSLEEIIVGE